MNSSLPLALPNALDLTVKENAPENWEMFKTQWNSYMILAEACGKDKKIADPKVKLALFISVIGGHGFQLIKKLGLLDAKVEQIIKRLDEYFSQSRNVTFERFLFNSSSQKSNQSCKDYINRLHEMISRCDFNQLENLPRHGIEEILICDRLVAGILDSNLRKRLPSMSALNLKEATKMTLSSTYHHQANGKAEAAVKIFKRLLKKSRDDGIDFQRALLEWRNIPLKDIGYSPAQLLMTQQTKTLLPTNPEQLVPKLPIQVKENWAKRKTSYKLNFDQKAKKLPELRTDQNVWIKKHPQDCTDVWVKGRVVNNEGFRKYVVDVDGRQFVRNRRFIRT